MSEPSQDSASIDSVGNQFDVIVLGAGIVGICTAYWNLRAGKSVCIIDRQPQSGLETSFANGGQVSVSHAEPWANPSAPFKVLKWLLDSDAPLLFRPRMDIHQWLWIAQFLVDCLPHRASKHTAGIVQLAMESRGLIQKIRKDEGLRYDERSKGILHFYRDVREFEAAIPVAELMRKYGCDRRIIDADEVVAIEPAFAERRGDIAGATYTADDESGDALKFTQGLAQTCEKMGATFLYNHQVTGLDADRRARQVSAVEVCGPDGYTTLRARDVIVSLGCWSAPFLRPYGVRLNIYPAKGYSMTIPTNGANMAPVTSLTDDEYKLVYSNFGDRLRVAGTAELSGYSRNLNHARCEAIRNNVKRLFPNAGKFDQAIFWSGLRPATPSNIPYVGRTRYSNLWLNTGHGTLGWTLGAGSGFRIANMIAGNEGQVVA